MQRGDSEKVGRRNLLSKLSWTPPGQLGQAQHSKDSINTMSVTELCPDNAHLGCASEFLLTSILGGGERIQNEILGRAVTERMNNACNSSLQPYPQETTIFLDMLSITWTWQQGERPNLVQSRTSLGSKHGY